VNKMGSELITRATNDVIIEVNKLEVPSEFDEHRKRQQSIFSFYQSKKSTAEGMMDISLLTANANQLKFILFYNQDSKTFYAALSLIIFSLVLQVAAGVLLIFRVSLRNFWWILNDSIALQRRFKSNGQKTQAGAVNEYLVLLIFLVTLINIMAAVLTTTETKKTCWKLQTCLLNFVNSKSISNQNLQIFCRKIELCDTR
jgi:hypothetical protein